MSSHSTMDHFISGIQQLSQLSIRVPWIESFSIVTLCKAILNVYGYRLALGERNAKRIGWLQGFFVCIILGSAGSGTVCMIRGESFGLLNTNDFWIIYGFVYWLMFSNPYIFQMINHIFSTLPALNVIMVGISGINRGYSLVRFGVDGVTKSVGIDGLVGRILCGTLAGCASGLWTEALGLNQLKWSFSTPTSFIKPSIDMKISFYTTIIYILSSTTLHEQEAQALGSLVFSGLLMNKVYNKVPGPAKKANKYK